MLEYLVGAPEEHIVLEALLLQSCSFKEIHNSRLNAGEIYHSSLGDKSLAVFVESFYSRDIRNGNASH